MLLAMCDASQVGLAALRAMAAGGSAMGRAAPGRDPVAEAMAAMGGFARAMDDLVGPSGARGPGAAAEMADLLPLMARACTVAAGSTLAYWRSLSEVYTRHQASLLQLLAQQSDADPAAAELRRRLADELRAYFREVGEVAMREARKLEAELAQVGEAVASATEQPDPAAPHHRHWKAKE